MQYHKKMEHITLLESLRELGVIAAGVSFAKLVEYLATKIYKKIDAQNITFLDVEEPE